MADLRPNNYFTRDRHLHEQSSACHKEGERERTEEVLEKKKFVGRKRGLTSFYTTSILGEKHGLGAGHFSPSNVFFENLKLQFSKTLVLCKTMV